MDTTKQEIILKAAEEIKSRHPEILQYKGLGFCGYASTLFQKELNTKGVESQILAGRFLLDSLTPEAKRAHKAAITIIETMPTENDKSPYYHIRKTYENRGFKMFTEVGHVVLLIDGTIYDITSGQFGLPFIYSPELFIKIWNNTYFISVTLGDPNKDFGIKKAIKLKPYNSIVTMEDFSPSPFFLKW